MRRAPMNVPFPGVSLPVQRQKVPKPRTELTTFPSGLRVVSQETYGYMSTIGLVMEAGTAYEPRGKRGPAKLSEMLAWSGTTRRSRFDILSEIDRIGGAPQANLQREQSLFCLDVLRSEVEAAADILAESLLMPRVDNDEIAAARDLSKLAYEESTTDSKCKEALFAAAYGAGTPLGSSLYDIQDENLDEYRATFYRPDRMVLAASGVAHEDLVRLGEKIDAYLPASSGAFRDYEAKYVGGVATVHAEDRENLVRIALACECGGWKDEEEVATVSVLQTLLGGGASFSAGGPGKGMYSRLYREVLNYNYHAEAAEAFLAIHQETGLLGIGGASRAQDVTKLAVAFADQFRKLAHVPVTEVELSRAKNMLKGNLLTQIESRLALFEEIGRQVSTFGKRNPLAKTMELIDSVTAERILALGRKFASKPPCFSVAGIMDPGMFNRNQLPQLEHLESIIRGG